jgi:cytochrome c oxidase cbb3-type subunit III
MTYFFLPIIIACTGDSKETGSSIDLEPVEAPEGEPPSFEMPEEGVAYLPIADVYAELEANKAFIFLDARPLVDYKLQHIQGAYSIPFYEVEDHFDAYPKEVWYVAYCGCPHAESGMVAEYFLNNGHTTVGILDEGYLEWEELGYPTEAGF